MKKTFRQQVRLAIADPALQSALDRNADRRRDAAKEARTQVEGLSELEQRASSIRKSIVANLDENLQTFSQNLEKRDFIVHHAQDAAEARNITLRILEGRNVQLVAKSKSMVTEEIDLNTALEASGIHVVETDLGEFIVQLRGERPAHIITPAVHLRREQVAATFERELGVSYDPDVTSMTTTARKHLRAVFLSADVGISGVNFGLIEEGALCILTNEGNGRMVTTLPPLHIAIMGVERLLPNMGDLAVMLQLLPRSATGQALTSYVSLLRGPSPEEGPDGAQERHVVLVDNGRTKLRKGPLADALMCIRCGACLNICPVFREIGGHAYGSVYPGPIGSVVSPGLFGLEEYGQLAKASTLCGACREVCPVQIDLPLLLLRVRDLQTEDSGRPSRMGWGMSAYAWVAASPARFRLAQKLAATLMRVLPKSDGWIRGLPYPLTTWSQSRHFPPFAEKPLRARVSEVTQAEVQDGHRIKKPADPHLGSTPRKEPQQRFQETLIELGGRVVICSQEQVPEQVLAILREKGIQSLLVWEPADEVIEACLLAIRNSGIEVDHPGLEAIDRQLNLGQYAAAQAGLTGSAAGFAETGTLVIPSGSGRSQLASLLPPVHIALLSNTHLYPDLGEWLRDEAAQTQLNEESFVLVSGPSRTADIEMTLTMGVHGPREVIVIAYDP